MHSYAVAPNGLEVREERLRERLEAGQFGPTLQRLAAKKGEGPDDELLRQLYLGTIAYYAGQYEASQRSLQRAYELTEDRYTKSATKAALALLTNDRALPYVPGQNEQLMVHYYAMQGFLRRGSVSEAAVEARRLGELLEQFEERSPTDDDRSTRAVLHYLSGAVFEAAGERADAEVSYRNARALASDSALPGDPERAPLTAARSGGAPRGASAAGLRPAAVPGLPPAVAFGAPGGTARGDTAVGDVVVVIEQGFVAHRVAQTLSVALASDDMRDFREGDDQRKVSAAAGISERLLLHLAADPGDEPVRDGRLEWRDPDAWGGRWGAGRTLDYLLQVSWPVYRRSYAPPPAPLIVSCDAARAPLRFRADLNDAITGDYRRDRAKILTRAIARAATKYALAELAEQDAREKKAREEERAASDTSSLKKPRRGGRHRSRGDDGKDQWLKELVNVAGVALERADTRSWHLLPATISVARLTLPAGRHTVALELADGAGGAARRVVLEELEVHPGVISFVTRRLWRDGGLPAAPAADAQQ